eukprot:2670936-Rhodomonas_salina.4
MQARAERSRYTQVCVCAAEVPSCVCRHIALVPVTSTTKRVGAYVAHATVAWYAEQARSRLTWKKGLFMLGTCTTICPPACTTLSVPVASPVLARSSTRRLLLLWRTR